LVVAACAATAAAAIIAAAFAVAAWDGGGRIFGATVNDIADAVVVGVGGFAWVVREGVVVV